MKNAKIANELLVIAHSLMADDGDKAILKALGDAFMMPVNKSDVKSIQFMLSKTILTMEDGGRLGYLSTKLKDKDVQRYAPGKTIKDVAAFLKANGAGKLKPYRSQGNPEQD